MKIGFLVLMTPYTYQNMDTALSLVEAALDKDHECQIYLYMDGVIATSAFIKPGNDRSIPDRIQKVIERGVKVIPCSVCCNYRGIPKKSTAENIKQAGLAALARMVDQYDRVITLGA
jgi:sulfur relay (sulfurtransferase) complex TusBCD TusD component (DsrE family)